MGPSEIATVGRGLPARTTLRTYQYPPPTARPSAHATPLATRRPVGASTSTAIPSTAANGSAVTFDPAASPAARAANEPPGTTPLAWPAGTGGRPALRFRATLAISWGPPPAWVVTTPGG